MTGLIGAGADLVLTIMTVITLAIGALCLLCALIFALIFAVALRDVRRKRHQIGDDTLAMLARQQPEPVTDEWLAALDAELDRILGDGDGRD